MTFRDKMEQFNQDLPHGRSTVMQIALHDMAALLNSVLVRACVRVCVSARGVVCAFCI